MALRKITSRKVGKNIKTIRLALRMSQERFGKAAGKYSQDTVAKWEQGQIPPALILKRISEISDPPRSVDWILNRAIRLEKEQNISKLAISNGYTNAVSARSGESGATPKIVENQRIFGQIVFDTLRQLIREEINSALKRVGSTAATKKSTRREPSVRRD
jgi:transcriptional regulator with XRE-family HTH domain